ncbi:hypothetical protein HDU97_006859 [Phlyctochytrium planicorne]|nr:hypothetical protein HDU97_006859 [Phlyctochytrium planicorne]
MPHTTIAADLPTYDDALGNSEPPEYTDTEQAECSIKCRHKIILAFPSHSFLLDAERCTLHSRLLQEHISSRSFRDLTSSDTQEGTIPSRSSSLGKTSSAIPSKRQQQCIPRIVLRNLCLSTSARVVITWLSKRKFPKKSALLSYRTYPEKEQELKTMGALMSAILELLECAATFGMSDEFWKELADWLGSPESMQAHESTTHVNITTASSRKQTSKATDLQAIVSNVDKSILKESLHNASAMLEDILWQDAVGSFMSTPFIHHSRVPSSFIKAFLKATSGVWGVPDRVALVLWWSRRTADSTTENRIGCIYDAQRILNEELDVGDLSFKAASRLCDVFTEEWEVVVGGLVAKASSPSNIE